MSPQRFLALAACILFFTAAHAYEPPCNVTRGIYCAANTLLSAWYWARSSGNFAFTDDTAHSGKSSLRVATTDPLGAGSGMFQAISLKQTEPAPVKIAGWCKADNVSEPDLTDHRLSIYIDFTYADGTALYQQTACFAGGTHDWQYAELIVKPEKPLASGHVYVFLRKRTGTAYFDDIFVGPVGGENLIKNPGFEREDRLNLTGQDAIYSTYADLNANAIHTYMSGDPGFWKGQDGKGNEDVRDFLAKAKSRGIGVWLTTGDPGAPRFKDSSDPNFPEYLCVNGAWGAAWTNTLSLAAAYDFAGLSLVPDEYNWTNWPLKDRYGKHRDPKVAEFYSKLPAICNCPACSARYEKAFGEKFPTLDVGMKFPAQTLPYLRVLKNRYDSTTEWLARSIAGIRAVNPNVRTDSLICVLPICSDRWWDTGIAWERLGYETSVDFPTTDPYIELHNYLGDSTHWYVTETAAHLTGCSPKRQCGIVLEATRLRGEYRELDPVEVYGSALSAVLHGAKELAWWHYDHLTERTKTSQQAPASRAAVKGVYGILKQADPWLGGLHTPGGVAVLHSRASDDFWRFYSQPASPVLTHPVDDPRYAAVAQKDLLYTLFRRGVPADLYYLEAVQERQLAPYSTIIVSFPFAISDRQAALLQKLAESGKTVVVVSETGRLDEMGLPRQSPALLKLCGLSAMPEGSAKGPLQTTATWLPRTGEEVFEGYATAPVSAGARVLAKIGGTPAIVEQKHGRGRAIFLAGPFGYDLPANRDNQKRTRLERIIPDPLAPGHLAVLETVLKEACGGEPWLLRTAAGQPGVGADDLEACLARNDRGESVVLLINWENKPVQCQVQLPAAARLEGFRMGADGQVTVSKVGLNAQGGRAVAKLTLQPQEACLWRATR